MSVIYFLVSISSISHVGFIKCLYGPGEFKGQGLYRAAQGHGPHFTGSDIEIDNCPSLITSLRSWLGRDYRHDTGVSITREWIPS